MCVPYCYCTVAHRCSTEEKLRFTGRPETRRKILSRLRSVDASGLCHQLGGAAIKCVAVLQMSLVHLSENRSLQSVFSSLFKVRTLKFSALDSSVGIKFKEEKCLIYSYLMGQRQI
jgi:hypothetical protein